ncbi:MAG: hypothetical protein KC425_27485, partial [Anaerolineales bacterium]|nr:hypothetical protein [Anaerolineales bacterium]
MNSSTVTALLVVPHGDAAPGETAVSIGVVLDNAIVAWSRCQLGSQPPAAHELLSLVETRLLPALQAAPLATFRAAAARLAALDVPAPLRRAVEESLLAAVASRDGVTRAELICREYALPPAGEVPPLYAALADDR